MSSDGRPADWPLVALGDVAESVRYGLTATTSDDPGAGPQFVRITDILGGFVDWAKVPYCDAGEVDVDKYGVTPGDILIARIGASAGTAARVDRETAAVFASYLVRFRLKPQVADSRFVAYVLHSPAWHRHVEDTKGGSAQPQFNAPVMKSFTFGLPPLTEQRRIASVLEALDDKIVSNRRVADSLHELATLRFAHQFSNLALARARLAGWPEGTLGELVDVNMGQSPPGSTYSTDPGMGLLLVQGMGGMGKRFPASDVFTTAPTKVATAGTTLMTVRAPVGAVNVAHEDVCLGRGVAGICSPRPAFTEYLVRTLKPRWSSEESGTIFPAVNRKQIVGLPVAVPPESELDAFEKFAAPIVRKLKALHDEAEALYALRDQLLPKLVSGDIRVASDDGDKAGGA